MSLRDASPAQNSPAQLHQRDVAQRDQWANERASEREKECVCVGESVCVHFLNAPLTAVAAYERGLVLVEQMAEC